MNYIDSSGFIYSTEEIEEAIKGTDITFEDYLEARGLSRDTNIYFNYSDREKRDNIQRYKPNLSSPQINSLNKSNRIQQPTNDEFLADYSNENWWGKKNVSFGEHLFDHSVYRDKTVDHLNNLYSQYDHISFKSDVDGAYVGPLTMVITDKNGNVTFEKEYKNTGWAEDDLVSFTQIKQDINAFGLTGELNPDKEVQTLADNVKARLDNPVTERDLFDEDDIKDELEEAFESAPGFEVSIPTKMGVDFIKIKNNHGVERTFNLDKGKKVHDEIYNFVLRNLQKDSETLNQEMSFKEEIKKKYLEKDKYETNFFSEGRLSTINWYELADKHGSLDTKKGKDFVETVFEDMGIDEGWFWFDEETSLRQKYDDLSEDQMKLLLKEVLELKVSESFIKEINGIGSEIMAKMEKSVTEYFGEGANYVEGKVVDKTYGIGTEVKSFKEFMDLWNMDAVNTFGNTDLNIIALSNLLLMQPNLSEEDRAKILKQKQTAQANAPKFVEFIGENGQRLQVPAEEIEYFQEQNPDAIYNEDNKKILENNFLGTLTGDKQTDLQKLQNYYEQGVANLFGMEKFLDQKVDVEITRSGVDEIKSKTVSLREILRQEFNSNFFAKVSKELTLEDRVDFESINSLTTPEGKYLEGKEATDYIESVRNRYNFTIDEHTVGKELFLLNRDVVSTWGTKEGRNLSEQAGAMVVNSLGMIFGKDKIYQETWGYTERDVVDLAPQFMSNAGLPLTLDQKVDLDRTTWEQFVEGGAGSVGILLEFAFANKVTAGLRTAKLFKSGTKSLNEMLTYAKASKYSNGRRIMTEAGMIQRASQTGLNVNQYKNMYNFTKVNNFQGKAVSLLTESVIEGVKFAALPSSSGHRLDAFSTGFGFGFAGQALAPVLGQITEAGVVKTFGPQNTPKWLADNASRLNIAYNLSFKGPTSFVVGSEIGEITKTLTQDILGQNEAFADYMDEAYGEFSDPTKRLISNYMVGVAFGLSHHMFPTKLPSGKYRWFNDFRTLSEMEAAKNEAFDKMFYKDPFVTIKNKNTGKESKVSPELYAKLYVNNKQFELSKNNTYGQTVGRPELQFKKGDPKNEIQRKKDLQTKYMETYQMFENMYQRARGKYDLNDPIKGQMILENAMKNTIALYKKRGIDLTVEWGNNRTMGENNRAYEQYGVGKDGKVDMKKIKMKFNVDQISLGVMPHEVGHSDMKILFGENARFKSEFVTAMGNIAKKIKLGVRDGKEYSLFDEMVERNGKWDTFDRPWENARISEWEMFSYIAEALADVKHYSALKESNAFGQFKKLLNNTLGKETGHTYDLKVESDIVKFFGDYIQAVGKGKNHVKVLEHLSDVIDVRKTEDTKVLRDAWNNALRTEGAPVVRLESSVEVNRLVERNKELASNYFKGGKWENKKAETEFKNNVQEIKAQKNLAEQVTKRKDGKIGYEENRSNEDIASENTRITTTVKELLKQNKVSRIKDLPEGTVKDAIITNLLNNNIGIINKLSGAAQKTALKDKNVPKDQVPSNESFVQEYTLEALKLIKNYNPKKNPEFGAYLQSKQTGLPIKYGTVLKSLLKGQVKGKAEIGKADTETKATFQRDFDLIDQRGEGANRVNWENTLFTTGKTKINEKTGIREEVVDVKKQQEVYKQINEGFNKLTAEQVAGLNYTNIRDFWAVFGGEKPHVIFTALSKNIIDNIAGKSPKQKTQFIGERIDVLYKLMGETNQVLMSGVKAEKGVKGGEGRSIQIRAELLKLFYKETKRTTDDATGSSITIQEKLPFNKNSVLEKLGIEIIKERIPNETGDGFIAVERYQQKKGLSASEKLNINRFLQEALGRNLVAKRGVEWIKENYKNKPELAVKLAEGQIIGRLTGGASKLFSEKLATQDVKDQQFFINEMKTERFISALHENRKLLAGDRSLAVVKTIVDHFGSLHHKHKISNKDLKKIGEELYKEFQNAPNIKAEMLVTKAGKTLEYTTKLETIAARSGKSKYDVRFEMGTTAGIERGRSVSRNVIREVIREFGAGAEMLFLSGESGGSGLGTFRKMEGSFLGGEVITAEQAMSMQTILRPEFLPLSGNRNALYETKAQFMEMVESVKAELRKEKGYKEKTYKGEPGRGSDLSGLKEQIFKKVIQEGKWVESEINRINEIGSENKKVLIKSIDIIKKLYDKQIIDHNQARTWLETHFSPMRGLGKKSAELALIPNVSAKEMFNLFGNKPTDYVLEHMTPAQYVKARVFDYILNGSSKKKAMDLTLRDYHTTLIPEKLDIMVNELAKKDMPANHLPGMDVMIRYYTMFHSGNFNIGFRNVAFGKNNLLEFYDYHPNLTAKEKANRMLEIGNQYKTTLKALGLEKGLSRLNSENFESIQNIEKALNEGRKAYKEKRGMSTWDFDDTLAMTKSGVRAKIPNPSGKPKPSRKVIFLAGGAGSGKSSVVKNLGLEKQGFKIVNSDISLEWLKKNSGLPENMRDLTREQLSELGRLQAEARKISKRKMMKFKGNAEGVVVDGTGGSYKAMEKLVNEFKQKGYDVSMLFVETSLETALTRNRNRKERSLLDKIVEKNHAAVQGNKEAFINLFGERFMEVKTDNLKQTSPMPKELVRKMNDFVSGYEKIRLDAEQFATEGKSILEKGGEFDFSEFNVVTEGSKGPFFQKALKRAQKYGTKDTYILTARPPESQIPIYEFLKSQGLEIPVENITGLGNSTGEAKALWMLKKFAEGYNDMYFADDAIQNVEAVKDVLKQLDIKYKVQQARRPVKEIDQKVKEQHSVNKLKDVENLSSPDTYNNVLYSKKHRAEYENTIKKYRQDLVKEKLVSKTIDEMFDFIEGLQLPASKKRKYEQLTTKWLATSKIKLPEDNFKIEESIKLAEKYKEDIFSYRNPTEIIEKYAGKTKAKPINPETVKEFNKGTVTNKKYGITEHVVSNTKEGQEAVREALDTHWGENSNPWCITQVKNGKLTEQSWKNWQNYSDGPKSIVFQNGKLLAFKANFQYWDRMDNNTDAPVITIKEGNVTKKVELVPIGKGKVQEFVMETRTVSKDKKTVKTEYHTTRDMGAETVVAGDYMIENRANGQTVKKTEYRPDGTKYNETSFKNGKAVNHKVFDPQGELVAVNMYGKPFGEMTELQVVKEKGDRIEHMGVETKTGIKDYFAEIMFEGKITEVGFQLEGNIKLENLIKTSANGNVRLDLNKVIKADPNVRGLPNNTKLYSENLSKEFNVILEQSKNIGAKKTYSEAKGMMAGKRNKGRFNFWGAEDFAGLTTYAFSGKGKQGEGHKKWFEDKLEVPFGRAYNNIHRRKQQLANDYKALRQEFKDVTSILNETVDGAFTVEQAIRVYNFERAGYEVPGLSKGDLKRLTNFVKKDAKLVSFAENLRTITLLNEGYVKPKEYWLGENITIDMNNVVDKIYRKEALSEFVHNREIIFGKWEGGKLVGPNMNKIEAIHGPRHREALENIIWRMENGTNRTVGADSNTNRWMNWVNNATGTIMFFNQKSAVLQTISSLNYMNGSFNNPIRAGAAFANQKQYWKDFSLIFNSDMLVQRRAGLRINVEAAELISRVGGGEGAFARFRAYLLEKGFIPTKYADSFAIASGGATFYRNSVRKYKKQGFSEKEAELKAWEDFTKITEETQQSSRPDLISMQQASALGRPILAFANTPMQMVRRHKRRIQDIVNNRGNFTSNVLSALYYGVAQTMLFSYLANAMFATDEEENPEHANRQNTRYVNTILDSYLRGWGTAGASVSALKNGVVSAIEESGDKRPDIYKPVVEMINVSPPIGSKVRKIVQSGKTLYYNNDVIKEMGLDIDNPVVMATANVISALTNVPTDRLVMKINNIRDGMMGDYETWERISLFMGLNKYSLGIEDRSPQTKAIEEVEKNIELKKKFEKYGVTTEKEVIRIDKGKDIYKLNKNQQLKILNDLNFTIGKIRELKKEEDRVEAILKRWDKDQDLINKLITKYPKDVEVITY